MHPEDKFVNLRGPCERQLSVFAHDRARRQIAESARRSRICGFDRIIDAP
jgi:hypothetical protein